MSKQELIATEQVAPQGRQMPPMPTFAEHLEKLELATRGFTCATEEDFHAGKALSERASRLRADIVLSYQPIKRAIDALKQPVLDAEKDDLAKVKTMLDYVDSECVAWKLEQDRIAQEAANQRREAERQRLEAERLAKLEAAKAEAARIEAERQRLEAERAAELAAAKEWDCKVDENVVAPVALDAVQQAKLEAAQKEIEAIEAAPVIAVRQVTVESEFSYRRGVRTKTKLTYRVVNPGAVKREFCEPSKIAIDSKIHRYNLSVKEPTAEQMAALADEIGGIVVELT